MRYCKNCGLEFNSKHKHVVFCSHKCANMFTSHSRKKRIKLICQNCSSVFEKTPSEIKYRGEIKYCCQKCSGEHRTKIKSIYVKCDNCETSYSKLLSRIKNTNFCCVKCRREYQKLNPRKSKGYWFENGYKVIYIGNGKGKKEHIIIMEKYIGRKLKQNECVHHINQNKLDNKIDNLELTTISNHAKIHRNMKRKSF